MPWAVVIREIETGKVVLVTKDTGTIDLDRYVRHGCPFYEVGDEMRFGMHDFTRSCACRPRIIDDNGYDIVMHQERKPN